MAFQEEVLEIYKAAKLRRKLDDKEKKEQQLERVKKFDLTHPQFTSQIKKHIKEDAYAGRRVARSFLEWPTDIHNDYSLIQDIELYIKEVLGFELVNFTWKTSIEDLNTNNEVTFLDIEVILEKIPF